MSDRSIVSKLPTVDASGVVAAQAQLSQKSPFAVASSGAKAALIQEMRDGATANDESGTLALMRRDYNTAYKHFELAKALRMSAAWLESAPEKTRPASA